MGQYGNAVNIYCASWNIVKRVPLVEQKSSVVNIYGVSGNIFLEYSLIFLLRSWKHNICNNIFSCVRKNGRRRYSQVSAGGYPQQEEGSASSAGPSWFQVENSLKCWTFMTSGREQPPVLASWLQVENSLKCWTFMASGREQPRVLDLHGFR